MSQRISQIAKKVALSIDHDCIAYGFWNELHAIYNEAWPDKPDKHPIDKWKSVLDALDREAKQPGAIFEKKYFRSFKGLARMFVLKGQTDDQGRINRPIREHSKPAKGNEL